MNKRISTNPVFAPVQETLQRAQVVYNSLLHSIIRSDLDSGTQLYADAIAQPLKVRTTLLRDALSRLEKDGLVIKLPYQGWFVREFQEPEIRDVYGRRAGLDRFSVRLVCQRITPEEIEYLRAHQATGEDASARKDLECYWL